MSVAASPPINRKISLPFLAQPLSQTPPAQLSPPLPSHLGVWAGNCPYPKRMVEKKSNENPSSCLKKQQLSSSVRNKKDMLECCEHVFSLRLFLPTQLNHFQRRSVFLPSSPSSLPFLHRGRGTEERGKEKRRKEGNGGRRRRFVPSPVWDSPNEKLKSLIKDIKYLLVGPKKIPPPLVW